MSAPPTADDIFLAHVAEVEELGWEEVAARMEQWRILGYPGDWQDPICDLPDDWSLPEFMKGGTR